MSKEYIEREVVIEGIRKYYYKNPPNSSYQEGFDYGLDKAQRVILNAPVADVVEVVRCIDCRYCISATANNAGYELCIVDDDVFPVSVQKQHFCGRGKRKDE